MSPYAYTYIRIYMCVVIKVLFRTFHTLAVQYICFWCYCFHVNVYVLFANQVGEDEFGYMLADILKQNNVDNSGMRFDPQARTALAFVTLTKEGEREFMFYRNPSADMLLQDKELDENLIKKVNHLYSFFHTHLCLVSFLHPLLPGS